MLTVLGVVQTKSKYGVVKLEIYEEVMDLSSNPVGIVLGTRY